jgi:hypothetical protein
MRRHREHPLSAAHSRDGLNPARNGVRSGSKCGGGGGRGCRDGPRSRGGDDRGLRHSEQPLDGLAVRPVTQFARELEYASRAEGWHADPAASAVHLGVPVSGARYGDLGFGGGGGGDRPGVGILAGVLEDYVGAHWVRVLEG